MEIKAPSNTTAQAADGIIDGLVTAAEHAAEISIETAIEVAAPAFALPVLKQIEEAIVNAVVEKVGHEISIGVQTVGTFIIIDTQISSEKGGISREAAALILAEKTGDPIAIKKALQDFADAQSQLVHSDGSVVIK